MRTQASNPATCAGDSRGIILTLPIRIESEANARGSWQKRFRDRGHYRPIVTIALRAHARALGFAPVRPAGCVVKLTRVAPRSLDERDNLPGSLKAIRDGVADWLGCDDSARSGITWDYSQRKGRPREYAVEIAVMTSLGALAMLGPA